jgi:hypothetical protein
MADLREMRNLCLPAGCAYLNYHDRMNRLILRGLVSKLMLSVLRLHIHPRYYNQFAEFFVSSVHPLPSRIFSVFLKVLTINFVVVFLILQLLD